jgi:putative ABC transport system ATP-binding protein
VPKQANVNASESPVNPVLRAQKLTRAVKAKILVNEATFQVHGGEILAVVGPSGAGKSSLLRLLNRLDEPTSGVVYFEEQDYRGIAPRDLRRKLGMVMQRPYLFPGTVEDNLQFGPKQRGQTLSQVEIESLLLRVGLPGYGSRDVANLSGGEAQRVSFARTLANTPSVLLLDEPTSALDEASKAEVEQLILEIVRTTNLSCVLVTHDRAQAARVANRVLVMETGRIVREGSAAEVLRA